jgi:hydroxymethylglutaryl-CoA synthase
MQVNYAMANAAMDAAARSDPKALSIRLGPLDDVGFITRGKAHRVLLESVPFHLLRIDNVLEGIVKLVLTRRLTGVLGLYECKRAALESNAIETSPQTITYTLQEAQKFMSIVLGGTPNQYPPDKSLKAAGLDSLSTMEVVHHINEQTRRKKFTPSDVTETFTVQDLVETINQDRDFRSLYDDSKASTPVIPKDMKSYHAPQEVKKDAAKNQTGDVTNFKIPPLLKDFEGVKKALTEAKILILRQEDARIFNHGAPIDTGDEDDVARFIDEYVALVEAFENSEAVVVAVIQGEVRGGGMIFPGMADVCLATGCASFGLPEIHRGMIPAIVSRTLVDRLGKAATRRMALTGECINAQRAMEMGLIDRVLDDCEEVILREVENLVRRWEKGTCIKAARTIKTELIPRNVARPRAMGTVMGTWLRQKRDDEKSTPNLEILDLSIENKVATLTMRDSLGQNTLRSEMTEAIRELIPRLQREARAIILTSGHNNFHVGLNPSRAREWAEQNLPISYVAAKLKETYMGFIELATLGIPIICVLNGKVHGGGLPIAFWCDYRIACFDVDMHFGNISRGMSPAGQLSRLFREYLSPTELMKAYLQNSHWTCDDLLRLGLVSGVALNRDEALSEAQRLGSFIAEQQTAAVRDTLYLMKLSYVADIADEESWLIAKKICNENISEIPFAQPQNESFVSNLVDDERSKEDPVPVGLEHKAARTDIGIIAMEVYTPRHAISADELERKGIPAKSKNGQLSVAVWDAQEDSISMALTACSQLLKNHVKDPYKIGRIEVGTESNVDMAKSIKSYLMDLLPNDHVDVEGVDNTNACYGGTAALLNALAWCRETGRDAIVVATDTADMDLVDSGWRGAAAVAMLVGYDPWITIHRRRVSCFKNTDDFFKPRSSSKKSPVIKTRQSMDHYIYALDHTINAMSRHGLDMKSVEAFVFHGGLCAAFMRLVERHLTTSIKSIKTWENHFECARSAANQIGGMYTASLYVNLASLLAKISSDPPQVSTLCLFSYGSGSTATLLHATVHHKEGHSLNLFDQLAGRAMVSYDTLSAIVDSSDSDKKAILRRFPGVYYRKLDREGKVERTYYQEP